MRKFLLRWWYTPNYEQDLHERMVRAFNREDTVKAAMREMIAKEMGKYDWLIEAGVVKVATGDGCFAGLREAVARGFPYPRQERFLTTPIEEPKQWLT